MAEMSARELELRRKHRDDFLYYAPRALHIRTKKGQILPFELNAAQLYIHERIEEQRLRTGRVRALVLKGRQQGCSTYVEGRFYWKVSHRKGTRAFILTHHDDATANLFGMAKRYHDHVPSSLKPQTQAANAKELHFGKLDSGYKVGTAGSAGVGRSDTVQYFHGSEVAYWPNGGYSHVAGVMQAIPNAEGTEVILESTAAGRQGLFFDACIEALADDEREAKGEERKGDYILIFVPWFWQPEYRREVSLKFKPTSEELKYKRLHGLDMEQIAWRRAKIQELRGVHVFRREYPATPQEAFTAEVPGALWKRELIEANRWPADKPLPRMVRFVVALDPSGGDDPNKNDEQGIVGGFLDNRGHVYVMDDVSGHYTPNGWGRQTVNLYRRRKADRIVGEKNFGGQMIENTIKTIDPKASYKDVHASRGKDIRAEPVAALYEQNMVHHVGEFIALEDEMVTWKPGDKRSPNRLDALVWLVTDLALGVGNAVVVKPVGTGVSSPYPL